MSCREGAAEYPPALWETRSGLEAPREVEPMV